MVVGEASINNIMGGIESTGGVRLHNHRRKLKQRFDIIKKLGQGTYGKVQLGINKETGQEVAIKTIKKCKIETEADLVRIRREIQIMSSVQHPNIIHIYEVFENREKMVLVMEYAAGGELYDFLSERKVLAEEEARRIFRQIATAVYYCHKHKICHRDLKLENILLDEHGSAKIADFGLSNVFDEQRLLNTFCGSPLYASPEIVKGTPYHGPEVDCWSLGVLLYTLVYGAMPFDGSNFKRLVKQISQGDYFEPKKPSPASPLIREMLTVAPTRRADMEKICSHWWVNEGYEESCLDIAEDLANQTPVRLDLLLSLAPPPPQVGSDKLVIANEEAGGEECGGAEGMAPARSHSVGSLMDVGSPAQRRLRDIAADSTFTETDENKNSPKRKLDVTASTENANETGVKRKERSRKKDRESSTERRSSHRSSSRTKDKPVPVQDESMTEVLSPEVDSKKSSNNENAANEASAEVEMNEPAIEGAMCAELVEEASKKNSLKERRKSIKRKVKPDNKIPEEIEHDVAAKTTESADLQNKENHADNVENTAPKSGEASTEKTLTKRKIIKKKIIKPKCDDDELKNEELKTLDDIVSKENVVKSNDEKIEEKKSDITPVPETQTEQKIESIADTEENKTEEVAVPPNKVMERRRSKIFETAEKFQNLLTSNESKTSIKDKPKKIIIPGVNVGGFKQAFERKASLTNSTPIPIKNSAAKKPVGADSKQKSVEDTTEPVEKTSVSTKSSGENGSAVLDSSKSEVNSPRHETSAEAVSAQAQSEGEDERQRKLKNAVNIISNAIDREGMRKSKSRPTMPRKPPVPFGVNGRSVSQQLPSPTDGKHLLKLQVGPEPTDIRTATAQVSTPEQTKYFVPPEEIDQNTNESDKKSVEVTLKSATLPRRKTSRAEITLNYPQPKPATMEFKTEMQHKIEGNPRLTTQRSEVSFPVSVTPNLGFRSTSLEPEGKSKSKPRERIIPISFEREGEAAQSSPTKPPAPRPFQSQRSAVQSQRSASLSRQSTNDSDTDSAVSGPEPIRKSPREYIIPIAVEGGGYVTPRAGSLEPSESSTASNSKRSISSRLRRPSRMSSLLSDRDGSEDESPFTTLHHGSIGRDSDNEDSRKDVFHLHRLRSSKPTRRPMEHADSLSSGEEDDDDGFEILTAENLFSTLLSRVRSLTQRLNVEDGGRPGFPSSRLLSHFGHDNFWNLHHKPDILSRHSPSGRAFSKERETNLKNSNSTLSGDSVNGPAPWRRSVSRDLATDIEKVFGDSHTLPRGKDTKQDDIDLSDLNLANLNLSEKDTVALSFLTPGLSRRIQKQLLAQLPRSEVRKLSRTLSMRNSNEMKNSKRTTADAGSDRSRVSASASDSDREKQSKYGTDACRRSLSCEPDPIASERLSASNGGPHSAGSAVSSSETPLGPKLNYRPIGHDLNPYLFSKSIKDDAGWKSHTDILKKSPSYERSISDTLSSASYGSKSDGLNYLTGVSNSDLSEGDRKLLENYRKSRGSRRALRSMSLYERNPESFSKPPLPFKPSESSAFDDANKRGAYTSPDQSVLEKYLSPVGSSYGYERGRFRSRSPSLQQSLDGGSKTLDRKTSNTRKISRFLRPDFFDTPPDESIFAKEKKEKELETQKVLKEIRDKRFRQRYGIKEPDADILEIDCARDSILGSDSLSEASEPSVQKDKREVSAPVSNAIDAEKTNANIQRVATEIAPESNSDRKEERQAETVDVKKTKSKISRLLRPKSYPDKSTLINKKLGARESPKNDEPSNINDKNDYDDNASATKTFDAADKKSPGKETRPTKIVKVKSSTQKNKTENDSDKNVSDTSNGEKQSNKSKFLQSLEKKFEKLRTFSNSHNESSEGNDSSLSRVGSAIRRLREQSLPRTTEPITESGLIKRAISVEDLPLAGAIGSDANKISRRSVTKILGLFKKYEDKDPAKSKSSSKNSSKTKKSNGNEPSVASDKKEKKIIKKSVKTSDAVRKNSQKSAESSEQNIKTCQESNAQETPVKISSFSAESKASSAKNSKNAAVESSNGDDATAFKNSEKLLKVSDMKKIDTVKTSADASKRIESRADEPAKKSKIPSKSSIKNESSVERSQPDKTVRKIFKVQNNNASTEATDNNLNNVSTNKVSNKEDASKIRPKSLFIETVRRAEPTTTVEVNANSTPLTVDNEKTKTTSKLPVSANRRSLDLGNSMNNNNCNFAENGDNCQQRVVDVSSAAEKLPNRKELKLDFTKLHKIGNATAAPDENCAARMENNTTDGESSKCDENRKSNDTNANVSSRDDSSMFLSPCDSEYSFDNWSVCSGDFGTPPDSHSHDFHCGGSIHSGDENANESVSDRIRRKSFYSRFNEKKRPRKSSLVGPGASFNEFDPTRSSHRSYGNDKSPKLCLDSLPTLKFRTLDLKSGNYSSKSVRDDLKYNERHKPSYNHSVSLTEPDKKYEKTYSRSGSLLKDPSYTKSYKPSIYHTYNPRLNRHIALYSNDTNESSSSGTSSGAGDGANIPGISTRYNSQSPTEPSGVRLTDDKTAKMDSVEKFATEM